MSTILCSKNYSIEIGSDCPDWLTVAWAGTPGNPPPENVWSDFGVVTRVFFGGQFALNVNQPGGNSYYADAVGTLPYAGAGCNCQMQLTMNRPAGFESALTGFQILQDATLLVDCNWDAYPPGVGTVVTIPFALAASAGSIIMIRGRWHPGLGAPYFYTYVTGSPPYPPQYVVAITNI